ncbi:unnamed protein product [Boreogadus saida]
MERSCGGTAVTSNQGQFPSPSQQRTGTSQGQTHTLMVPPCQRPFLIKKHVAAVAALESEVGNPNVAVFGCMIEFRSAFVVLISREIVRQDVEVA